jgi:hypothetical protein
MQRQRLKGVVLLLAAVASTQAPGTLLGGFSTMRPGQPLADGWQVVTLPGIDPTRFELVDDGAGTVMRATAAASAASLARGLSGDAVAGSLLTWRWRVDRVVSQGDVYSKQGDDYAARLYVMFDYPLERLSWLDRNRLRLARWLYGDQVPAAALCYVWANRTPLQVQADNAYTDRVKMVVLRNADSDVGAWATERRDIAADFRAAFGEAPPPLSGIAISADTDQTGETVTAWFGDIALLDATHGATEQAGTATAVR